MSQVQNLNSPAWKRLYRKMEDFGKRMYMTTPKHTVEPLTIKQVRECYPKSKGYTVYKRGDIADVWWCGFRVCGPRITDDDATRSNARADLPRIKDANRESGREGANRG
jgi:hypothetical protein